MPGIKQLLRLPRILGFMLLRLLRLQLILGWMVQQLPLDISTLVIVTLLLLLLVMLKLLGIWVVVVLWILLQILLSMVVRRRRARLCLETSIPWLIITKTLLVLTARLIPSMASISGLILVALLPMATTSWPVQLILRQLLLAVTVKPGPGVITP